MAATQRKFQSGQIRFMSPERGALQLATCAVLNAISDLWAKAEPKPLWKLVRDFSLEQFMACSAFRYLTDVLNCEQALEMLKKHEATKGDRMNLATENKAVPAYNTSVGWLGHSDEKAKDLLRKAAQQGFRHFKLKAGLGIETDRKRLSLVREVASEDAVLMVDVNQLWDVDEAIDYMKQLADFKLRFIEEPTSPDDVMGHAKIRRALKPLGIGDVTGEHVNSRVMFKQLLPAESLDAVQLDASPPHSLYPFSTGRLFFISGSGMVELCTHLGSIDFDAVSGKASILEYIDHLHDAFAAPARITSDGFHVSPMVPGYSCDVKEEQFEQFECPEGIFWRSEKGFSMSSDPWRGVLGEQTS